MTKLIDNFNRHINYLRISVTDRCNLRCTYCMPKEGLSQIGHDDILRYEEILRIARIAAKKGISKIRITGGEPLVRKNIISLVSDINSIEGIEDISITTNGVLLKKCAAQLKKAGLKRINISLDSLEKNKYSEITRGGNLDDVLQGITEAKLNGFNPIKINFVPLKGINDNEIATIAKLTMNRPVHIRFIEFMPVNVKNEWSNDHYIPSEKIKKGLEEIAPLLPVERDEHTGPARMFKFKNAKGQIGFISPLSNHFCDSCNRLRLTADGKLRTCLFSDQETDLRTPIRNGCTDKELEEIITSAILNKPEKHKVLDPSFEKCHRGMSAIGG
jgi:cyclic pyranopterin phosphate synthase